MTEHAEPAATDLDAKILACAQAAHEANRAYCIALGDHSQGAWEDAPQWQRDSAVQGVWGVLNGNTPEQSHEGWLAEKMRTGWKYGPVKDPVAKEHPCFMPYADLPPAQREKDSIFVNTVRAVATALQLPLKLPHEGLTFGDALDALKSGHSVARTGWHGHGMFVYLVPEAAYPARTAIAKRHYGVDALVPYAAYFALKNSNDIVSTWAPSVGDALAVDWYVVE